MQEEQDFCLNHEYHFYRAENGASVWICDKCGQQVTELEDSQP